MSLEEDLTLERYKFVTDRQGYFTDLAKETFSSFARTFAASVAGAVTLVSLRNQLQLDQAVVGALLNAIGVLITLAGAISATQVLFCLWRWYGFRKAECKINPSAPPAESWAWIFEGMYVLAIAAALVIAWWGISHLKAVIASVGIPP